MHSPDITEKNVDKIAELFPPVITESVDDEGNPVRAIDFDLLRQELSDHVIEGPQERYQLDWPGKREALFAANAPIAKTLRPSREESVDFDTTHNLFIEGDNLDALKLLQESYLGKVKLIYIDPPYNTGNDFIYSDAFAESTDEYLDRSGQSANGAMLVANTEANGRFHSAWLTMMYPRLKLARNLLSDTGLLAVSIDDNEVDNLRRVLTEIFGAGNFVAQVVVQANRGGRDYLPLAQTHEYLVLFARNYASVGIHDLPTDTSSLPLEDGGGRYEARELRNRNPRFNRDNRPNLFYPFYVDPDNTDEHGYASVSLAKDERHVLQTLPRNTAGADSCWRWGKPKAAAAIVVGDPARSEIVAKKVGTGRWNVYEKSRKSSKKAKTIWDETEMRTEAGTREVREMFGSAVFDHPKPVSLLKKLVALSTKQTGEDIVLDYFAGSASTAHAVLALNAEDGGNRRFVMVQLDEECGEATEAAKAGYPTIAALARERVRRAALQAKSERNHAASEMDTGFRALRVASTNMSDVRRTPGDVPQEELRLFEGSVKPDRTAEDLLFEVLLDSGLELGISISVEQSDGHEAFVVEDGALVACFENEVSHALVRTIAERKPLRAVFRDSGFASDADRINAEQVFAEVSPSTEVKAI